MRRLFVTGVPVTGDEFVGRQGEIKEIKYLVTQGQSVILTVRYNFSLKGGSKRGL